MSKKFLPHKNWIIIADASEKLPFNIENHINDDSYILACDGAYNTAKKCNIDIDAIIGDSDSITIDNLIDIKNQTPIEYIEKKDQNKTDLEKAFEYADQMSAKNITVINALNNRLDHTLYNLQLLKKFYQKNRPIKFIDQHQTTYYAENTAVTITGKMGDIISLFGAPSATVNATNLKYPLNNHKLEQNKLSSISNELTHSESHIDVDGCAFITQNT